MLTFLLCSSFCKCAYHIVTHNYFLQVLEVAVEEVVGEVDVEEEAVVVEGEDGVVDEVVVVEDEEV